MIFYFAIPLTLLLYWLTRQLYRLKPLPFINPVLIPMLIICVGTCILRVLWVFGAGAVHPGLYTTLTSYPLSWTITSLAFLVYYYRFSAMRKLNKLIEE